MKSEWTELANEAPENERLTWIRRGAWRIQAGTAEAARPLVLWASLVPRRWAAFRALGLAIGRQVQCLLM